MREVTVKVYKFNELSEEVKNKLIENALYNWGHDSYHYTELLDEARRGNGVFDGLDYLMDYQDTWEVDYDKASVDFYGAVDLHNLIYSTNAIEEIKKAIEEGKISPKYKDVKHLDRLIQYIIDNAEIDLTRGVVSTYLHVPSENKDVLTICELLDTKVHTDARKLQMLLECDLYDQYEYLNSIEYISQEYEYIDNEYFEDGKVFN